MFGLFKRKAKSVKAQVESAIAKRFPPDSKYLKGNETTDEEWTREQKEQRLQKKLAGLLGAAVVLLKVFGVDVPIDPAQQVAIAGAVMAALTTWWAIKDIRHDPDAGLSVDAD